MTIRTPKQALAAADATRTNVVGYCQQVTRGYYLAPSAGDVDHDGDADAYDGWLSEPSSARHPGDRNPPAGYPVSFKGGSRGHGHRAISRGNGILRSTDFDGTRYHAGVLGNGTIAQVEAAMGVVYLGWSETIDGQPIPKDAPSPAKEEPAVPMNYFSLFRDRYNHNGVIDLQLLDGLVDKSKSRTLVAAAKTCRWVCRQAVAALVKAGS